MSDGLTLIRSVIEHQSRQTFRALRPEFFDDNERPIFQWVDDYLRDHGALPNMELLQQVGIHLPPAHGEMSYHRSRLRNRMVYAAYGSRQQQMMEALQGGDIDGLLGHLEFITSQVRAISARQETMSIVQAMAVVMEDYELARRNPGLRGVSFGYETLDEVTGGARDGEMYTIVARPGVAKTWAITRMACAAWASGRRVGFVSNEMEAPAIARRVISIGTGVNADFIQRGTVCEFGQNILRSAIERVGDMPPFFLTSGSMARSTREVRSMIDEHQPHVLYIDASYLMRPDKQQNGFTKRFELVSETMRELHSIGNDTGVPIVQTVQFNRSQKQDEEMSLDNIGQTDEIGQLSSLVLGIKKGASPNEETRRRFRVLKNRHGQDGLSFETRFDHTPFNMDEIEEEERTPLDGYDDWDGEQGTPPAATEWNNV